MRVLRAGRGARRRGVAAAVLALLAIGSAVSGSVAQASVAHVTKGVGRYVALGNSYSSGDAAFNVLGNAHYFRSTNIPHVDECHRSFNAFPELISADPKVAVAGPNFVFAACAEARVADFMTKFPAYGNWGEGPQLDALSPANVPSTKTGLVTISIGGTDVGLYPDLLSCVHPAGLGGGECALGVKNRLSAGLALLATGGRVKFKPTNPARWWLCPSCNPAAPGVVDVPSLAQLFRDVHQRAPNALILVVGYPALVPPGASSTCQLGKVTKRTGHSVRYVLAPPDMALLTKVVLQLNLLLAQSVAAAHAHGVNVQFVATYSAFRGHGPCDAPSASSLYLNKVQFGGPSHSEISPASFHPNAVGQYGFARLVLEHL